MALGAEARKVLWLVLRDAIIMVAIGTVIGAAPALTLTKYTESMLYGVKAQDPWTLAAAGAVLIAVTAMAGLLPARRATRVEPMRALREE
jgi:ABC-type antimicrobial peptide transport system permease subunit